MGLNSLSLHRKIGKESLNQFEIIYSNDDRFKTYENCPQIQICKFCGKELLTKGIYVNPSKVNWFEYPEPCNCLEALKMQALELANKEIEAKEKLRAAHNKKLNNKITELFGKSGLSLRARMCTFDKYIVTDNNKQAFIAGKEFVKNFNNDNKNVFGLFIAGDIGVGKSFLAFCIANMLLLEGRSVIVATADDLLNNIKNSYDKGRLTEYEILKIYKEVDLLIIDDIGKEELTEWGLSKLNNILYYRHEHFKSVIFTSNYNDDLLIKRISPTDDLTTAKSILDRLYQTCKAIIITGESWRGKHV